MQTKITRRLAAILAVDMVGFSRLMARDEAGTLARQKAQREALIDPRIAAHHGRIVKTMGDGLGDIMIDGKDILGGGVNVATRLEGLAPPGGLCLSDMVHFPGRRLADWETYWHAAMEYRDQGDFDHLTDGLRKAGTTD